MKGVFTEIVTDINQINMFKKVMGEIRPILSEQMHIERFHDNGEGVDRAYNVYKISVEFVHALYVMEISCNVT